MKLALNSNSPEQIAHLREAQGRTHTVASTMLGQPVHATPSALRSLTFAGKNPEWHDRETPTEQQPARAKKNE